MRRIANLLFVFVAFCLSSCEKTTEKEAIFVCGEFSPKWLLDEIDRVEQKSVLFRYVEVKKSVFNGTDIVMVHDPLNSSLVDGTRFFDCSGNCYDSTSDEYNYFWDNKDKFVLIWRNY